MKGTGKSTLKRMARKLEDKRGKEAEAIMKTLVDRLTTFSQAEGPWETAKKPNASPRKARRSVKGRESQ